MQKKDKMIKTVIKLSVLLVLSVFTVTSCSSDKKSLQEYYVDNQENNDFVLVDVPASLISGSSAFLTKEQNEVLETIRKINIMAYPIKDATSINYQGEKTKLMGILAGDDYEELMKANSDEGSIRLYFKGEEEAIDEVIFFGAEDSKGFILARLLGDDMNISNMVKLAQSMETSDIDVSQFEGIMDIFNDIQ